MIKKVRNGEEIRVVDDMVMSPTYTRDAAGMIRDILMKELPFGTYHIANNGYCSWFDFAKAIFEMLDIDASLLPVKKRHLALCGIGVCRHTPSFDKPFLKPAFPTLNHK
jgi:dTDP-4-dehydrorhamnose reductase